MECSLCKGAVNDRWTIEIKDDKTQSKIQLSGHKACIDDLFEKYCSIQNVEKMSLKQVLKKLNLEVE